MKIGKLPRRIFINPFSVVLLRPKGKGFVAEWELSEDSQHKNHDFVISFNCISEMANKMILFSWSAEGSSREEVDDTVGKCV